MNANVEFSKVLEASRKAALAVIQNGATIAIFQENQNGAFGKYNMEMLVLGTRFYFYLSFQPGTADCPYGVQLCGNWFADDGTAIRRRSLEQFKRRLRESMEAQLSHCRLTQANLARAC